jgi:hypothetical protein
LKQFSFINNPNAVAQKALDELKLKNKTNTVKNSN